MAKITYELSEEIISVLVSEMGYVEEIEVDGKSDDGLAKKGTIENPQSKAEFFSQTQRIQYYAIGIQRLKEIALEEARKEIEKRFE